MAKINFSKIVYILLLFPVFSASAQNIQDPKSTQENSTVFKQILDNGLTILVLPRQNQPDVAVHLIYNVGSIDEGQGERGLAHLLEHMIFKGTKEMLSEADIALTTSKLAGYCNANTSYDRTKYIFQFPKRHWQEALPILADCMSNCSFKQDLLNSEFKAVIQELKMYRDNHQRVAFLELMSSIFTTHPYHYSVIGIKQDIWDVQSDDLMRFYKKHYIPNNAVLVVVGDVDPVEVTNAAQKHFGNIPANLNYKKQKNYHQKDITSKSVRLYRDVKSPSMLLSFNIPSMDKKLDVVEEVLSNILAGGTSSRLYRKLVLEEQLSLYASAQTCLLVQEALALIYVAPKDEASIDKIKKIVISELADLAQNGPTDLELQTAINIIKSAYIDLSENVFALADDLGTHYMATGDENYLFNCVKNLDKNILKIEVQKFIKEYMRPSLMHEAIVLPIAQDDLITWRELQEIHEKEDVEFLKNRIRTSEVEAPKYANQVQYKPIENIDFVTPTEITLKNGLKVFYHHNASVPKIGCYLKLRANYRYEDQNKLGIFSLMEESIIRGGTTTRDFNAISDILSSHASGVSFDLGAFNIGTFSENLKLTLDLLGDILANAKFDEIELEKVKSDMCSAILRTFDDPKYIASDMLYDKIYDKKFYTAQERITLIESLTRQDVIDCYKKFVSPKDAYMIVVGDLSGYNIADILEDAFAQWQGDRVEEIEPENGANVESCVLEYSMNIDQTIVMLGANSINAKHEDHLKLILAEVILSNGMNSRIFDIRQKTGMFYNASAELATGSGRKQDGYICISMTVSPENVQHAEFLLLEALKNLADTLTDEEVERAKNIVLNWYEHYYAKISSTINILARIYELERPWDYIERRIEQINKISTQDIREALNRLLDKKEFVTVRVGRVI